MAPGKHQSFSSVPRNRQVRLRAHHFPKGVPKRNPNRPQPAVSQPMIIDSIEEVLLEPDSEPVPQPPISNTTIFGQIFGLMPWDEDNDKNNRRRQAKVQVRAVWNRREATKTFTFPANKFPSMKIGLNVLKNHIRLADPELWAQVQYRMNYAGSTWFLQHTLPRDKRKFIVVQSDQPRNFGSWLGRNIDSGLNSNHTVKIEIHMEFRFPEVRVDGKEEPAAPRSSLEERYWPIVEYEEDWEVQDDDMYVSTQEFIDRVKRTLPRQMTLVIMPQHSAASSNTVASNNHNASVQDGGDAMDIDG